MLHGNQTLIGDGYPDRPGLHDIAGTPGAARGFRAVLAAHAERDVPLNLHLSGTLIASLAWHDPDLLGEVADLAADGLVEILGSTFAQNVMPLFTREHNRRQLAGELAIAERWLGVPAHAIRTLWVPERVWSTRALAPVVADPGLQNGGYRAILLDDRLGLPAGGEASPRARFDAADAPLDDPGVFTPFRMRDGHDLVCVPGCTRLRRVVPAEDADARQDARDILARFREWHTAGAPVLATYMEDLERVAGIPPWSGDGPTAYARFLDDAADVATFVRVGAHLAAHPPRGERRVDDGCFRELAVDWGAGELYEGWTADPAWRPYAHALTRAENAVRALDGDADPALGEAAWTQVLASAYETAWHDAPGSVHADADRATLAPWARAVARHALAALPIARAARWARGATPPGAVVETTDVDEDGEEEIVLRNGRVAFVVTPAHGGRVVYAFRLRGRGAVVVGNPADDWGWLESLNDYMDAPPQHPGAFVDVGREHNAYHVAAVGADARGAHVHLVDDASDRGLEKTLSLRADAAHLDVRYAPRERPAPLVVEVGLSPDYATLLHEGVLAVEDEEDADGRRRGYRCGDVSGAVELVDGFTWSTPRVPAFPHGFLLAATAPAGRGGLRLHVA